MKLETLRDLYVDELKDLWSAENQILKALPKMIKAATHPKLKKAFAKHEKQTRVHVTRLERICKQLDVSQNWDSSIIGAVAIPVAEAGYSGLYTALIEKLLTDPDFIAAAQAGACT